LYVAAAATAVVLAHGTDPEVVNPWTPAVWQSFELASAEAVRFRHDFIGTEHVLLGLMSEENGRVSRILKNFGVQRETVRAEIEKIVGTGPQSRAAHPPAYTPRAQKAFQIAIREAKAARAIRAETEHVLIGLLCQGGGVAAIVLEKFGVNAAKVREQLQSNQKDSHE
jgi:ATP-dependent Clp protease ATP-binding subunit ClpC